MPFLRDKGRKLEGGVCDKWFMYVHYLGTVILLFFVKLFLLKSALDGGVQH
jgi:hypothetical protein